MHINYRRKVLVKNHNKLPFRMLQIYWCPVTVYMQLCTSL
uniref:Uncharacterized protein n=1 Tax=Triticum urartu TaxID=4572 RepID=A0A8R7P3T2_TRIUA